MNEVFKAGYSHIPRIYEYISKNMTRALPMLQGIDEKNMLVADGYSLYIYGREINAGLYIDGLLMFTPSGSMYIYTDDESIFERLDFFKLIRAMAPRTVRSEKSVSAHMESLLRKTKISFSEKPITLMKCPFEALNTVSANLEDADGIALVSDEGHLENILDIIAETEKSFNKKAFSSYSDVKHFAMPKMKRGNYIIAEVEGKGVSQGVIELCKAGVGLIGNIYTTPDHRRKGYAKIIVTRLVSICKDRIAIPFLFVESDNLAAISLYEGLGFAKTCEWTLLEVFEKII